VVVRREVDGPPVDVCTAPDTRSAKDVGHIGAKAVSETLSVAELNNHKRKNAKIARISESAALRRETSTIIDEIYLRK
jgi:hypothetical protein